MVDKIATFIRSLAAFKAFISAIDSLCSLVVFLNSPVLAVFAVLKFLMENRFIFVKI